PSFFLPKAFRVFARDSFLKAVSEGRRCITGGAVRVCYNGYNAVLREVRDLPISTKRCCGWIQPIRRSGTRTTNLRRSGTLIRVGLYGVLVALMLTETEGGQTPSKDHWGTT